jgi:hypothetical protein
LRRALPLAVAVVLLAAPAGALGAAGEPIAVTANAPAVVASGSHFRLTVSVAAEAGALDIAAQPLRLRVRLAHECGGSFAGTRGPTALDRVLPAPSAGASYRARAVARPKAGKAGAETVCAFLEDAQGRQFATETEERLRIVPRCAAANRRLIAVKRSLRRLDRRIARARRHATAQALAKLRHRRRALVAGKRRARRLVALSCRAHAGPRAPRGLPRIKHLFLIVLENEDAADTFGPHSPSPYLGKTLRAAGAFVPGYYGIGHESLDNYIAMVSGQPPNPQTQADCLLYTEMVALSVREDGVAVGTGCVFPPAVKTVANQLEDSGRTWKGYMQDMASGVMAGETPACRHPALGGPDKTRLASAATQYAARHNPFVYFHALIDTPACQSDDVDLAQLPTDLRSERTTPDYAFIAPDLCADGHDETCADGHSPGGGAGIDAFLREWVPRIQASPAYLDHGAILITFDEAESGAESCCNEPTGPNSPNNGGTSVGDGGGRVGAVVLSPCVKPGTVTREAYNHYSLLRFAEDNFGLSHLAYAGAAGLRGFGADVFDEPACGARRR